MQKSLWGIIWISCSLAKQKQVNMLVKSSKREQFRMTHHPHKIRELEHLLLEQRLASRASSIRLKGGPLPSNPPAAMDVKDFNSYKGASNPFHKSSLKLPFGDTYS